MIPKYYFIHNTIKIQNLINILKTGYIELGKNVPKHYRNLGGSDEKSDHIYCQIYFDDLKNIEFFWGSSIIIHPNIINDIQTEFHRGWGCLPTLEEHVIYPHDSNAVKSKKISSMKKFIKNPNKLPKKIADSFIFNHEVLFNKRISLKKYAIGITCNFADEKIMKKINDIIKLKKYKLFIINGNSPVPSPTQLIQK